MEEYKQIETTNYFINNNGIVINKKKNTIMSVKPNIVSGYCAFEYTFNKKRNKKYIHRLVAELFIENPNNYPDVHHIDNDKTNNNVNNLEWTSRSKNCRMYTKNKSNGLPRGVSYNKVIKKYQSQISINYKNTHLGYFTSIEEAHNIYLQKYKEIMGIDCIY